MGEQMDTLLWEFYSNENGYLKKLVTLPFNENMDREQVMEEFKSKYNVNRRVLAFQYKGS